MFLCVGENECIGSEIGEGLTIQEAIYMWAYNDEKTDIVHEFNKYRPRVYEIVKRVNVSLEAQTEIIVQIMG